MDTNRKQNLHTPRRAGGLSVLLTLAALVCLLLAFAATANAETVASGYCGGEGSGSTYGHNLTWQLEADGTLSINGTGKMRLFTTQQSVPWDEYREKIKELSIQDGVTSISGNAFRSCDNITTVALPESIDEIGSCAFAYCKNLISINMPQTASYLGASAFSGCTSLKAVRIPDGITEVGNSLFFECFSLAEVELPNTIKSIETLAFDNCNSLSTLTLPDGLTTIEDRAFLCCAGLTNIVIPKTVTSIGFDAFYKCINLKSAFIYGNIEKIPTTMFEECTALERVVLSESITEIGIGAFRGCTNLTDINLPNAVTDIGNGAFMNCTSLREIQLPAELRKFDSSIFKNCSSLNSLIIPDKAVGTVSLSSCTNLTSIVIGDSITQICSLQALKKLSTVTIGKNVSSIDSCAFKDCVSLTSVVLPDSVVKIERNAFDGCKSLSAVDLGKGLSSIGREAFYGCMELTNISIPDGVEDIPYGTFAHCSKLKTIVLPDSVSSIGEIAFFNCSSLSSISLPANLQTIGSSAFSDCSALSGNLHLPSQLVSIGNSAFYNCHSLSGDLIIPDSVTIIGNSAFYGCSGFTGNLTIPSSVTTIGYSAFYGCSGFIGSLTIPGSLTTIPHWAFKGCKCITTLQLPSSVTNIDSEAFYNCDSLQTVYYDGTKEQLDKLYQFPSNVKIICSQNTGSNGTTLSFSQKEYTVQFGDEVLLTLNITSAPGKAQEQLDSIVWTSLKPAVFPENPLKPFGENRSSPDWKGSGIVYDLENTTGDIFLAATPKAPGKTTVTLTTADGASASCTVVCLGSAQNTVSMENTEYTIKAGATGKVFAHFTNGEYLEEYTWEWSSSNENVVALNDKRPGRYACLVSTLPTATHDDSRTFRAVNPGTAVLTCKLANGMSASRTITVLSAGDAEKEPTIGSNHYDRPKYDNPQQAKNLSILSKYESMLQDAYDAYMKALETGVNNLKVEEYGEVSSITDQADALRKLDEKRTSGFLTPNKSIPKEHLDKYLDYAYQSVCTCLLEATQSAISLDQIDLSTIYAADSSIVKEIVNKVGGTNKKFSYPDATIHVTFGTYLGGHFGDITVTESRAFGRSYTIVICSKPDDVNELVADYINELKKLERTAIDDIYRAIVKDVFGQTLSSFTEKYLTSKFRPKFKDFFKNHGFGEVDKALGNVCSFYESLKNIRNHVKNPDLFSYLDPEESMNQCLVSYDGISDKLAKSAAKKLAKVQKQIIQAIVDYKNNGEITAPKGPGFWELLLGIQCPVSVAVYDGSGVQIGYVGDDDLWYNDSLYIETDGEAKLIYSLNEQAISLKITGTDYGAVNCMLEKWADGEPVYRTNYYDIAVESGSEIVTDGQAYALLEQGAPSLTVDGRRVYADEQISAAQSACVTVSAVSSNDEGGYVTGGGAYVRGDPVLFRAYPEEGYDFIGWYDADMRLVSVEDCYEFTAREPVALTAFFASHEPSLENYLVELSAAYEGRCTITVEQTDTEYTLTIACLDDTLELSSFSVYAAQYDQTGRMLDVGSLPRQITGQSAVFTGSISKNGATLFILDAARRPVAQAIISE